MYLTNRLAEPPTPPADSPRFRVRVLRPVEPLGLGSVVGRCMVLLARQKDRVGREVISPNPAARLACLLVREIPASVLDKDRFFHLEFERDADGRRRPGIPPRIEWKTVKGILTHPASFGEGVSDLQVLENLKKLDDAIFVAREFVNNQVIIGGATGGGAAIGPDVRRAFDFLKAGERDALSIYRCYKGGGPA